MSVYIVSYYRSIYREDTHLIDSLNVFWAAVFISTCLMPFSEQLAAKHDQPRRLIGGIGALFIAVQFFATFTKEFWAYAVLFSLSFGIIHGLLFMYSIRLA